MELAMKYRALDASYNTETKQLHAGQVFDPKDFNLSPERLKEMVKKGLIAPVAGQSAPEDADEVTNGNGQGDGGDNDAVDLHKLTRAELDELAAERGIDVAEAKNKGDVIDLLEKAEKAPKNKAEPGASHNK
jgi:hypothetical protein